MHCHRLIIHVSANASANPRSKLQDDTSAYYSTTTIFFNTVVVFACAMNHRVCRVDSGASTCVSILAHTAIVLSEDDGSTVKCSNHVQQSASGP
jgi:hypothetical protein